MGKEYEAEDGSKFRFGYEETKIYCPRCCEYKALALVIEDHSNSQLYESGEYGEYECECGNKLSVGFCGV